MSFRASIMNQITAEPVNTWVYINSYQSDPNSDLYVIESTSQSISDSLAILENTFPAANRAPGTTASVYNAYLEYDFFEVQLV